MATLTLSSIPSNINSYERLLIWAAQAIQSSANGQTISAVEGAGPQPTCQVQVAVAADNTNRFVVSAFIPLTLSDLNSSTQKTWMAAADVSSSAPHANFGSN
jgi:hypothetical protein